MRIAVLLGELGFDSQRRIVAGILERARASGGQVFLFAGDAEDYDTRYKYESGEFNIYNLPDFSTFDGVIVGLDTIHNQDTVDNIVGKIRHADIPCVSLNVYVDGFMYVKMDNGDGIREIMEHLIERHGVRQVFHIAGPKENNDADERLTAVSDVCRRYMIPFDEEHYLRGNYTNRSGYEIMDRFLKENRELPDAFVAANDLMAVGAISRLNEAGYKVPDDVIVTGYDNSGYAEVHRPGLTTVARGEKSCGILAYELLESYVHNGIRQDSTFIQGKAIFSGSCGCEDLREDDPDLLSQMYIMRGLRQNTKLHYIKLLMAEATGLRNYEDFIKSAKTFIPLINPKEMYLCIKGDPEEYILELNNAADNIPHGRDVADYMDNVSVVLAWKDGQFLPERIIPTSELIPPEYRDETKNNFYLFLPLHHQENCFGYVVFANEEEMLINDPFVVMFSLIISSALETVLRQDTMRAVMKKLDKLSSTDALTGVMNRVGAHENWPAIRKRAKEKGLMTAVIFADIDGLKNVNDRFGHEEGDRYIVAIADVMKRTGMNDGFIYRYGGDELVIVCNVPSESEIQSYIERMRIEIAGLNRNGISLYRRDISIGTCISDSDDLDEMIKIADRKMYVEKKKKHGK